jgi:hypothetical protein
MTMCETTDILMWSKLYLLRNQDNKEVVEALVDIQRGKCQCVGQLVSSQL